MKNLIFWLVVFLLIVGGIYAYGNSLPEDYSYSETLELTKPTDKVWETVRSVGGWKGWINSIAEFERIEDRNGRILVWKQQDTLSSPKIYEVLEDRDGSLFVYQTQVDPESGDDYKKVTIELQSLDWGKKTNITMTEEGVVSNPFNRFVFTFTGHDGFVQGFLRALEVKFGRKY